MTGALVGKNCIVTGGSGGIGQAIAARLIRDGADVTILARGTPRLEAAARHLGALALPCDFACLNDVRIVATDLAKRRIDVLVLNAATVMSERTLTGDGYETTLAVNHLSPYLLARLLVPSLSPTARVVIVCADPGMLARAPVDFENMQSKTSFSASGSYMRSKNMNVMFSYALARRLENTGILVNAAHPGIIRTELARNAKGLLRWMTMLAGPFLPDATVGADTPAWLASSPEINSTGGFYKKCRRVQTADHTRDVQRQELLWQTSAALVDLEP